MPDIRILPETISNKIAAGEVVERPVSVVKELIENALDAKATSLLIEVSKGGRDLIRVSDNGYGMSKDNALLSIERYATSKIVDDRDIFSIKSFGFRGEALPSIASISRFTLVSRTHDSGHGVKIEIDGGKFINVSDTGAPAGTMVEVKNIYYNTPARRKFLKSVNTEMGHIADSVSAFALAFPDVTFCLNHNGRTVRHFTSSDSMLSRIEKVLGVENSLDRNEPSVFSNHSLSQDSHLNDSDFLVSRHGTGHFSNSERLFPVQFQSGNIIVTGYVGSPFVTRSSGARILLFVNSRVVSDRNIVSAIVRGFKGRIMKGKFPVAAIFLEIPCDEVDVNVHPAKLQVRFVNQGNVFEAVSTAVNEALSRGENSIICEKIDSQPGYCGATDALEVGEEQKTIKNSSLGTKVDYSDLSLFDWEKKHDEPCLDDDHDSGLWQDCNVPHYENDELNFHARQNLSDLYDSINAMDRSMAVEQCASETEQKYDCETGEQDSSETVEQYTSETGDQYSSETGKDYDSKSGSQSSDEPFISLKPEGQFAAQKSGDRFLSKIPDKGRDSSFFASLNIIGQLFGTYIVAQFKDKMVLIDQHAAHERVVFEKLKKRSISFRPPSQRLIVPETLELNYRESALLEKIMKGLSTLGIEVEPFGDNTFVIKSIPGIIDNKVIKPLLMDILDMLLTSGVEDDFFEEKNHTSLKNSVVESFGGRDWLDDILILISCHNAVRANHSLRSEEIKALMQELDSCQAPFHCPHGRPLIVEFSRREIEKSFKRTG
ncbi:putative DNA mismatch repair protein mutL [Desulfamplus magnetovallimortis]|uniref:DNA mismatch repair protein MutL n=1 Tax=Desulfamplus magnetovallimortis TaxID=1246637 RepID=A0A1W1HA65_9BACT|nr:DNA mismatch repair endonuclease MutL [Desulfamplus magnetovallimortis]SLM29319.1 putative DNA mismatch repair protein mutL [Desulfamplus magnetovallimortis]